MIIILDKTVGIIDNYGMAKKTTTRKKLSDQVRLAIDTRGESRYRIAKETGISEPTISRFMSGERGLPMKTLDRLAAFLRLRITMDGPRAKKRKG